MPNKVVVINAFEPGDFFIDQLSQTYLKAVAETGAEFEVLAVNDMELVATVAPKEFTYKTLEPDLQHAVDVINNATSLIIFIGYRPAMNAALSQFISRIFHLRAGAVNTDIWGRDRIHDRKVRIVSVIEDEATWEDFKERKDTSILPTHKVNFRLFGFNFLSTATFGYLRDNELNDYGLKQIAKVAKFAASDMVDPIDDLLNF